MREVSVAGALLCAARFLGAHPTARDLAGTSVGKFETGPTDLSTNRRHLDGFAE